MGERGAMHWLKQAIPSLFFLGLVISIASFIGELQMGRDATHYLILKLGSVQGRHGVVATSAAAIHALFAWWARIVGITFGVLPLHIPHWMHGPISIFFFAIFHAWTHGTWRGRLSLFGVIGRIATVNVVVAALELVGILSDKLYQFGSFDFRPWIMSAPYEVLAYLVALMALIFVGAAARWYAWRVLSWHARNVAWRERLVEEQMDEGERKVVG
ncbi:MAG: hypothetical protein KGJ78_14035 [Alphaproteobacteria bacterium]|nr:hypothetical protein [Alphaproteobacteria bacterium]